MNYTESATFTGTGQRAGKPEREYNKNYDSILGRTEISGFGTPFYQLMSDPNNVTLEQEMKILALMPIARQFCIENYPKSNVVPSIGVMYGQVGVTLIYQPDIDTQTWQARGMLCSNGMWMPDPKLFDKDSEKRKYIEIATGKEVKIFLPNEWDFPDYRYNHWHAVPFKNNTGTLLDIFDVDENHGFPRRFAKDFEEAKKEYKKAGLDSVEEGWERWIFKFLRSENSKHGLKRVHRFLDYNNTSSGLTVRYNSNKINQNVGGRFPTESRI